MQCSNENVKLKSKKSLRVVSFHWSFNAGASQSLSYSQYQVGWTEMETDVKIALIVPINVLLTLSLLTHLRLD